MYRHYCKDSNYPGHTKSWERCCDMRAFATRTPNTKPIWKLSRFEFKNAAPDTMKKIVFA